MPAFVQKSLETDKKRKALEAQIPENWKNKLCPNPSTAPPPNIQARPALRAPGSTRAQNPRAAPHPKSQDRCLVYAAVYRLYGLTELEIGIEEGRLIRTG